MSANSKTAFAKVRRRLIQERHDAALSHDIQNTFYPEGASESGRLPKGWRVQKLGSLAVKIGSGSTPRGGEAVYKTTGIPLIRSMNIHFSGFKPDGLAFLGPIEAEKLEQATVQKDDVLLNITGASIGRVTTAPESLAGGRVNQHVCIVRPTAELFAPFLAQFLASPEEQARVMNVQVGATRQALTKAMIQNWHVPFPPLPEQRRIVAEIEKQFTRLEAGVAALKRVQANLKRYRAAVLKAACEGRLVPTEAELAKTGNRKARFEAGEELLARILAERRMSWQGRGKYKEPAAPDTSNLPSLPEGWTCGTADQSTSVITDGEHITPERSDSGILLLSARNVLDGRISLEDVDYVPQHEYDRIAKRLVIVPGDVLLSCSGSVGRSTVVPDGLLFTLVRSVAVLKPLAGMGKYLSIALRSPLLKKQITAKQTQTAQANIFQGKIKALCIPLPPLAEQTRIVAEVERRLSVVEELETVVSANLQRATRLRQSILQKAFTGQL